MYLGALGPHKNSFCGNHIGDVYPDHSVYYSQVVDLATNAKVGDCKSGIDFGEISRSDV